MKHFRQIADLKTPASGHHNREATSLQFSYYWHEEWDMRRIVEVNPYLLVPINFTWRRGYHKGLKAGAGSLMLT
jgi:hypothetical protein